MARSHCKDSTSSMVILDGAYDQRFLICFAREKTKREYIRH